MKLYTEEQIKKVLNPGLFYLIEPQLTPIELPSDEEIEELSKNTNFEYDYFNHGFVRGAEWIKEQIIKQNQ